jgi:hypothetical protein
VSGTASFSVAGARFELGPGQQLTVPARTPHCLWNGGDVEAHLVIEFRPGLLKQEYYETTFGLARDGKYRLAGFGNLMQFAVLAAAYRLESRQLGQPLFKRYGLLALAPLGWVLGYRAHYARYCTRPDDGPGGPPIVPDHDKLAS